jgi:hypothetical protein
MDKIKAYQNILKTLNKNKDFIDDDYYYQALENGLKNRIEIQEVCKKFKISDLPENNNANFIKIDDYRHILFCAEGSNYIAWPDDNKQPSNEYVYKIGFPEGAYIFGYSFNDYYPKELFIDFFIELKSYKPKYLDTNNKSLFFSPENAFVIHNDYKEIFDKYLKLSKEEYKKSKKRKLEAELEKINNEL